MIYKIKPKNCNEVKNIVEAETKKAAILYFAALMHLRKKDLLQIYTIC
tara:strand:+ start:141 stop:284 length:144 start_codon:yes stop_codon:yes gene_type:complete